MFFFLFFFSHDNSWSKFSENSKTVQRDLDNFINFFISGSKNSLTFVFTYSVLYVFIFYYSAFFQVGSETAYKKHIHIHIHTYNVSEK